MRAWWDDLLIEAGGGMLGTVAAAAAIAFAGKAAGLFDEARAFSIGDFAFMLIRVLLVMYGIYFGVVLVSVFIDMYFR